MELIKFDPLTKVRRPTVDTAHQVGDKELYRQAIWVGDGVAVTVDVAAFVVNLRCRGHLDGSWDVLGVMSRFHILGKDEFLQPVERIIYRWTLYQLRADGSVMSTRTAVDYNDNPCEFYQPAIENSFNALAPVMSGIDFFNDLDPVAWEDMDDDAHS